MKISEKYQKIFEIAKLEIGNSVSGPSSGAVSNCFGGMENTLNTEVPQEPTPVTPVKSETKTNSGST